MRPKVDNIAEYRVVKTNRVWNNSMYIYSDYAVVFDSDNCGFSEVFLGIDYLDCHKIQIDDLAFMLYQEYNRGVFLQHQKKEKEARLGVLSKIGMPPKIAELVFDYWDSWSHNQELQDRIWKLLTSNLRSKFRISLRDQLLTWICTSPEKRKYKSPLSYKQWECV